MELFDIVYDEIVTLVVITFLHLLGLPESSMWVCQGIVSGLLKSDHVVGVIPEIVTTHPRLMAMRRIITTLTFTFLKESIGRRVLLSVVRDDLTALYLLYSIPEMSRHYPTTMVRVGGLVTALCCWRTLGELSVVRETLMRAVLPSQVTVESSELS